MKNYLLPNDGKFYKANLHCHSVISDGAKTPEELKKIYMDMGYSIIAYTDHDIMIPHDDLTDENFLALHGFEMEVNEGGEKTWKRMKTAHVCYIGIKKDNLTQPMWNENYLFANAPNYKHLVKFDPNIPPYERKYSPAGISEMMQIGRDAGFFVTYNHPTWSREAYPEYANYNGMHAFEMFNGGCITEGYDDYNPRVYDDILGTDKRIYCIGTDDNHNWGSGRHWDSGIAYTMIKSPSLEYESVTKALLDGHFYASEGPAIFALWVEDGKLFIDCTEADSIVCTYEVRRGDARFDEGTPLTSAEFEVRPEWGYARITVTDKHGKHATTNAYYFD